MLESISSMALWNIGILEMTVEEAAKRLNRTKWAVYKMIREKRGVGAKFQYKAGKGYFILSKDLRRFLH